MLLSDLLPSSPPCFLLLLLLVVAACHSRAAPGDRCKVPDQLLCHANDHALVCAAGTWTDVPCKGPHGCAHRADGDACDDTVATEGDACPRNPALDYACTADRSRALVCQDGRFGLWRDCRGPDGCQIHDERDIRCDTTLGEPGDPCGQQGTFACSVDRKAILVCDGTSLVESSSCRGPAGCHVEREGRKVDCDDAAASEGDPCDQPRRITCSLDHKAELVCDKNHYVKKRECRRTDCRVETSELYCD